MKKVILILNLACSTFSVYSQYHSLLGQLPSGYQKRVVVYDSDSVLYVFKSRDYLKKCKFDSIPDQRSDSLDEYNYRKLIETLTLGSTSEFVVLKDVNYRDSRLFPNPIVLMELFSRHKIMIVKKNGIMYDNVSYSTRKKRGRNVKWHFVVYEKGTKKILFEVLYGTISN